jgi:hypothetical protein
MGVNTQPFLGEGLSWPERGRAASRTARETSTRFISTNIRINIGTFGVFKKLKKICKFP